MTATEWIARAVDERAKDFTELADRIWDHPELRWTEFSAVAAQEAAPHNVRINVIAPGQVMTPATQAFAAADPERNARASATIPMRRGGQPDELAYAIRFLLSDEASFITGACIPVDGGKLQQLYVPV